MRATIAAILGMLLGALTVPAAQSVFPNQLPRNCTANQIAVAQGGNIWACGSDSSGAPANATYITQTANGSLSNEQALGALSSGVLRAATTTGVVTSLGDIDAVASCALFNNAGVFGCDAGLTYTAGSDTLVGTVVQLLTTGVQLTAADGVGTILGLGNGNDENLTIDLDNAGANTVAIASGTGVTGLTFSGITLTPAGVNTATGKPATIICQATVTLDNDQIKALPSLGIAVVPAPGADLQLVLVKGWWRLDTTAGAYAAAGANTSLSLQWGTAAAMTTWVAVNWKASLEGTAVKTGEFPPPADAGSGDFEGTLVGFAYTASAIVNQPMVVQDFFDPGSDYTLGNAANTLKIMVSYHILNTITGVYQNCP